MKGLADELPPEAKEAFDVDGLKEKIDDLIGKIKKEAELATEPPPPPPPARESGFGLLSAGEAWRSSAESRRQPGESPAAPDAPVRALDPRRGPEGRRSRSERRAPADRRSLADRRGKAERRESDDRRDSSDRRSGERREPVPEIDLSEPIDPRAATVKLAPDGTPTEVAGLPISPRMAKLIQIIRREKDDNAR